MFRFSLYFKNSYTLSMSFSSSLQFLFVFSYTTFIVLYPIGVTGELLCIYAAQQEVAEKKLWSYELPNAFNFAFSYQYTLILIMLMYIPCKKHTFKRFEKAKGLTWIFNLFSVFPQLYLHMFSQRRKVVGGAVSKDAAKKA